MKLTKRGAKFLYIASSIYYGLYGILAAIGLVFPNKVTDAAFSLPMGIVHIVVCGIFLCFDHQVRSYFPDRQSPRWVQVVAVALMVAFLVLGTIRWSQL